MSPKPLLFLMATLTTLVASGCGREPLDLTKSGPGQLCSASQSTREQALTPLPLPPVPPSFCEFQGDPMDRFDSMAALVRLVLGRDDLGRAETLLSLGLDASSTDDRNDVIRTLLREKPPLNYRTHGCRSG